MYSMDELFVVLDDIKNILLGTINFKLITTIIEIILIACLGLYVAWFGIKKVINVIKGALIDNGKLAVGSSAHRKYYKDVLGWDDEDYNDTFDLW